MNKRRRYKAKARRRARRLAWQAFARRMQIEEERAFYEYFRSGTCYPGQ